MTEKNEKRCYTGGEMCGKGAILLIKIAIFLLSLGLGFHGLVDLSNYRKAKQARKFK